MKEKHFQLTDGLDNPGQGLLCVCVYNESCYVHFKGE